MMNNNRRRFLRLRKKSGYLHNNIRYKSASVASKTTSVEIKKHEAKSSFQPMLSEDSSFSIQKSFLLGPSVMTSKLSSLEALLFAADEPLNDNAIAQADSNILEVEVAELAFQLDQILASNGHAIGVQRVSGGWRLATRPEYAESIKRHLRGKTKMRLSRAALESVSIIAYRQPVTRAEVDIIRGVESGQVLRNLIERGLIKVAGRKEVPGRPILYETTDSFLTYFGLDSIKSLPSPEELLGDIDEDESRGTEVQPQGPFEPIG